jgi:adenine phosphoribosyltransferase
MEHLRKLIHEVPDFPKAGINFYDITTLLQDAEGLNNTIEALTDWLQTKRSTPSSGLSLEDLSLLPRLP